MSIRLCRLVQSTGNIFFYSGVGLFTRWRAVRGLAITLSSELVLLDFSHFSFCTLKCLRIITSENDVASPANEPFVEFLQRRESFVFSSQLLKAMTPPEVKLFMVSSPGCHRRSKLKTFLQLQFSTCGGNTVY